MLQYYNVLKNYKLRESVLILLKLKFGFTKRIVIPKTIHPLHLRKSTSDIETFYQVFGNLEYGDIPIKFSPKVIIDLGANIGLASVYFANKYPDSKIISVEPETSNFDVLKVNTARYKNIILEQKAISNIDDKYVEILDKGYGKWGFITEIKDEYDNSFGSGIKTITINKISELYNINCIDILKIDIEGAEKELFETNFEKWIPITRCIIIELHDGMKKGCSKSFFKCISNYNFSFRIRGENLVLINENLKNIDNTVIN